jgi:hypothetical protein
LEIAMRGLSAPIVLLAGMAAATLASADPGLRNVAGLDAALPAGKTCQGVFNSGRKREGSQGALQLQFAVNGDVLTAYFWRRLGKPAYDRAAYAITQPRPGGGPSELDFLGEVGGLTVTGNTIRYVDPTGGKVQLTYDRGGLLGQSDPRGGTDYRMTRVAVVRMVCR